MIRCNLKVALKEWAPAVKALSSNGDQTILLRKGGIKDPTFKTKAQSFLLFPTAFHTNATLLKPEYQTKYQPECEIDPKENEFLELDCIAQVTGQWKTNDAQKVLEALDPLHMYSPDFLDARLRWKPTQPLTILELRAYTLRTPLIVASREEFWGCFSWVDFLDTDFSNIQQAFAEKSFKELVAEGYMVPALDDTSFAEKQKICRDGLSKLKDLEVL
jgi:hypothetical protein